MISYILLNGVRHPTVTATWPQEDILSYLVRKRLLVFAIYTTLHIESKLVGGASCLWIFKEIVQITLIH